MELLCIIFTFIMARIVASYSKSTFVTSFFADVLIQLLHIVTFGVFVLALLSSQSMLYRFAALYPASHLVSCVWELGLDILYAFGFYEIADDEEEDDDDDENNTPENVDEKK